MKMTDKIVQTNISQVMRRHSLIIMFCSTILLSLFFCVVLAIWLQQEDIVRQTFFVFLVLSILAFLIWMVASGKHQSYFINLFKAELVDKQNGFDLLERICCLSEKVGVPIPAVYRVNESSLAAYSMCGLRNKDILVLNKNAIEVLDKQELDSVIIHGMYHIKHKDSLLQFLCFSTVGVIYMLFWYFALSPVHIIWESIKGVKSSYSKLNRVVNVGLIIIAPALIVMALIFGIPLRRILYEQQYRADLWTAHIMGSPIPLMTAMAKLSRVDQFNQGRLFINGVLYDIIEPSSKFWVLQQAYRFVWPSLSGRVRRLKDMFSKIGNCANQSEPDLYTLSMESGRDYLLWYEILSFSGLMFLMVWAMISH